MRNAFADEITRIASIDERLILLSGDIGNRLFDNYKNAFPNRFLNCGVAEANMTGVAAGLAMNGLRPITYTIAPFATTRCFEQIRDDICYHNLPTIIVGIGSGLGYAELGATHQSLEDIAILRALPNMTVLCPADPQETRLALRAALNINGPVYLRLGKKGEQAVHEENTRYRIGHAMPLRDGSDCAVLSTGIIAPLALEVANSLAYKRITTNVIHFPSVKPLDYETLVHCVQKYQLIATIEEHSRIGGFGSAVAEWLSDYGVHTTKLLRYGTQDNFLHEAGGTAYARERHGLSASNISNDIAAHFNCLKLNVS
jgi:transketolase